MDIRSNSRDVSRGIHGSAIPPSPGFRHLAVAAATEQKKTGKKHPGKAILAGQYRTLCWDGAAKMAQNSHITSKSILTVLYVTSIMYRQQLVHRWHSRWAGNHDDLPDWVRQDTATVRWTIRNSTLQGAYPLREGDCQRAWISGSLQRIEFSTLRLYTKSQCEVSTHHTRSRLH